MSEMEPSFWLAKVDNVSLTHEEGVDALHLCATVSRGNCRLQENDVPLYTAERLSEVVAAERERCAKICEDTRKELAGFYNSGCNDCAEAIRSAKK